MCRVGGLTAMYALQHGVVYALQHGVVYAWPRQGGGRWINGSKCSQCR
jgi:hypothetical protein